MRTFRLAPDNMTFGFMRLRRVSYPFSALMSIISVLMFLAWGLNFGIDFAGGTLLEVRAKFGNADLTQLRGLGDRFALGEVEVQAFGGNTDATVRIRLQPGGDAAQQAAVERVREAIIADYEFRRIEVVGPRVSGELLAYGMVGLMLAIFAILIYLWFRFEWQFALGAMIANVPPAGTESGRRIGGQHQVPECHTTGGRDRPGVPDLQLGQQHQM